MATYRIDPAPDGPVWVIPGDDRPSFRLTPSTITGFWGPVGDRDIPWHEVLTLGAVSDTHPDLSDEAPTPWSRDDDHGITDARGRIVYLSHDDVQATIVRAVNDYAARLLGGAS